MVRVRVSGIERAPVPKARLFEPAKAKSPVMLTGLLPVRVRAPPTASIVPPEIVTSPLPSAPSFPRLRVPALRTALPKVLAVLSVTTPAPEKVRALPAPEMAPPNIREVVEAGEMFAGPLSTIGASIVWLPAVTEMAPAAMPLSRVIASALVPIV